MNIALKYLAALAGLTTLLTAAEGKSHATQGHRERVPVLLELFTSEGCSSCPPADKLLEELDRNQPIQGADLIVLSEHVDYWNHLGWADPSSSPAFTKRQQDYASAFGSGDIYTPQLVVDGSISLVGSDRLKAESAIKNSLGRIKLAVNVAATRSEGAPAIHIEISQSAVEQAATVYLVLAHDHAQSNVARGENAGRALTHIAVVYSMQQIAKIKPNLAVTPGLAFKKDLRATLPPHSRPGDTRLIVFVQESSAPRIIGVAQTRL